ncbi:hypothetical protein [Methanobrevibacter sp.]|uniref:hypothetical protein n=1 Tax=Methanobrevibacter sp. TaxID=66852 RepID=UPI00386FD702
MRYKKLMVLAILLVSLLAVSVVSAEDNVTSDTGLAEKTVNEAIIENQIIDDSDSDMKSAGDSLEISDFPDDELKGEDVNLTVEHKKIMTKDDRLDVSLSELHGIISILVDGKEVYHDDDFWFGSFSLEDLYLEGDYGNHTLEVKYLGNRYNPTSYNSTFYYSYVDLYADSDGHIIIDSEEEMSAKLYLDGDLIYDGKIDGYTTVSSKKLYLGYIPNYTIVTSGKGKYKSLTLTGALDYRVSPEIDVPSTVGKGDDKYIKVTLPPDANGNLKVYLNDIDVNASFENGKSIIPLNGLDIGDYNVRIVYDSDSKYESYERDYYNVKVTYNPHFKITIPSVAYLTDSTVTFTGSKDVDGKISIYVDSIDKTFKGDYKNGIAKIKIFDEESGPKTYQYKFEGTYNGEKFEYNGEFNVTLTLFTVSLPKTVYEGHSFKATFTGSQSMNGQIDSEYFKDSFVDVRKGKATVTINGLKAGVKTIKYDFTDSKGNIFYSSFKVNVIKPPVIKANDFKTLYTSKKAYQVRILYNQSKSIGAGKTVTFYFYKNGKIKATKTSKTDSRGYAKVNFNVVAGEYKVKTKYGPTAVTKKYIVKPIITINKIGKGNSRGMPKPVTAKKFVFGATLKKVDGKYLKGKKVKITFYRWDDNDNRIKVKTLTKKINSKGVVKVTYKKFPFKIKYGGWYDGWFAVVFSYLKEKGEATLYVKSASPIKYAYC